MDIKKIEKGVSAAWLRIGRGRLRPEIAAVRAERTLQANGPFQFGISSGCNTGTDVHCR